VLPKRTSCRFSLQLFFKLKSERCARVLLVHFPSKFEVFHFYEPYFIVNVARCCKGAVYCGLSQ